MPGKIDDRYADFNFDAIVGILPAGNGGTGNNTFTTNRVITSVATGDSTNPVKLQASNITVNELNKLSGISAHPSTINTRLTNLENLMGAQTKIHDTTAGYQLLTNGLIMQWGRVDATSPEQEFTVVFPIAFPNKCLSLTGSVETQGLLSENNGVVVQFRALTSIGVEIRRQDIYAATATDYYVHWLAIGH